MAISKKTSKQVKAGPGSVGPMADPHAADSIVDRAIALQDSARETLEASAAAVAEALPPSPPVAPVSSKPAPVARPVAPAPPSSAPAPEPALPVVQPEPERSPAKPAVQSAPPTLLKTVAPESASTPERTAMTDTANAFETSTQPAMMMQENVRSFAEKGLEQARTQYDTMKKAAENASSKLEATMSNVNSGVVQFNLKVIEAMRSNANAAFDHFAALSNVKTLSEAVELQSAHARKQFDSMGAQTKDLTALLQKVASDASEPVKAAMASRG